MKVRCILNPKTTIMIKNNSKSKKAMIKSSSKFKIKQTKIVNSKNKKIVTKQYNQMKILNNIPKSFLPYSTNNKHKQIALNNQQTNSILMTVNKK